jgi:small subunit ribosomal protein S11
MADEEVKTEVEQADLESTADAETPAKKSRKKARRSVPHGQVHILATFNNTIISVTDSKGGVLTTASAGSSGFRGSKKGTAYAAQIAAEKAIGGAKQAHGVSKVDVFIKGIGMGREAAIRTLSSQNVNVESIKDVTGIPHGGVRARSPKRN